VLAPVASHFVRRQMTYVGPPEMTSVAKTRSMPYLMSLLVMGVPSSNLMLSLRWYVQVLPPFSAVAGAVARSGTAFEPAVPGLASYISRPRWMSRKKSQLKA